MILCNTLFLSEHNFSEKSIADDSSIRVGTFTDTWSSDRFAKENLKEGETDKTYWEQLHDKREVIQRIKFDETLENRVKGYQAVIDALLEEDETFIDFISKTFIYSAIGRRNPVYVSQSPLQLSGEFTQEQFVKQVEGIPIVLMPVDKENDRYSDGSIRMDYFTKGLDGIANPVRYYKVAEYIYQNYVPLCVYENDYAVWCLPERYDEMAQKIKDFSVSGEEIKDGLASSEQISLSNAEVVKNSDGSLNVNYTGRDPAVYEIQELFDISAYVDESLKIAIKYETDTDGDLQLYYTTNENENYTSDKVITADISGDGTAYFTIPLVTQYTRLRLETPENSKVKIKSMKTDVVGCELVTYGYDGPYLDADGETYHYLPFIHFYDVKELPYIWAAKDKKNSSDNAVIAEMKYTDGFYQFDTSAVNVKNEGNYLKVHVNYIGKDQEGKYEEDDETVDAVLKVGNYVNGMFETKYSYQFSVIEGEYDYMFRISSDYYWYLKQVNAVSLECGESLKNVEMKILQGD